MADNTGDPPTVNSGTSHQVPGVSGGRGGGRGRGVRGVGWTGKETFQ